MNEIKNYINNIIKLINTEFANIAEKCGVLVRRGATVASYSSASKKATVYFDGDSNTESAPYYNKSGHTLEVGQRVYIFHLFGNPSQGWIMMRAGAYPDDEGGGGGGGLDGVVIDGSGNAMTNASLSDNILTLTKGTTFATQSDLTTHTGNSNIHVTSADKTRWDSKSDFSGSYNDLTDVPSSFPPSSHSHGNITNDGGINTTTQIASGDRLIISDTSSGDLNASSITFGGSTTQYLANNGTWQTPDIPDATTTTPKMDGTAAVGTETTWAKGDHVHPVDTSRAASTHSHGNITNGGDMTATAAIASGDRIVINDESASKLTSSTLTFGTSTTQYLANNGTWQNVPVFSQVQADWSTTDSSAASYIANKPNITTLAETAELSDAIPSTNYQTVSQAEKDSWNAKSTFSGNYSDLSGKPTIPTTLAQLATDTTHRVVTDAQINQWNSNYTLPSSGIPLNDLSEPVRDLLTNKTSLFESDIIIGDVYFKRYAAGRLMVSEVE